MTPTLKVTANMTVAKTVGAFAANAAASGAVPATGEGVTPLD
jgi:hypothetical protein